VVGLPGRVPTSEKIVEKGSCSRGFPLLLFGSMTKQRPSWMREGHGSPLSQRVRRYGPLLFWLAFISLASTGEFSAANTSALVRPLLLWLFPNLSEAHLATAHFLTRKAAHFTEYAVLAFLARRAFVTSTHVFIQRLWFHLGLLLVVIYALLDEFHQSFVPSRTASLYDSAIDIGGGLMVLLIFKFYDKFSARGVRGREAAITPLAGS
jgi:VanZ family protein